MLGSSNKTPKPFLSPPISAVADREYLKEKKYKNTFETEAYYLNRLRPPIVKNIIDTARVSNEDKLIMFSHFEGRPSHSFGILTHNGVGYAVGSVAYEDIQYLDSHIILPEKLLQRDSESCHLCAYKSAKSVFAALCSNRLAEGNSSTYQVPASLEKYAQSYSMLHNSGNFRHGTGRMGRLLTKEGMEHFSNSQSALLSYRSYKKFFKHASQGELRTWLQEDEAKFFNDDIKRAITAYTSNSINREEYRDFIDGYLSFKI